MQTNCLHVKFFRPTTWKDRVVSFLCRGIFCHCGLSFWYGSMWWYLDSLPGRGMKLIPTEGPQTDHIAHIQSSDTRVMNWVKEHLDTKYGWLDGVRIVIRKWTGISFIGNPKGMVCSEMIATMLNDLEITDFFTTALTPDELGEMLCVGLVFESD